MPDTRIKSAVVGDDRLTVELMDGRAISTPLAYYPRLATATSEQRNNWQVAGGGYGLHWPDLDEDLSVDGLLALPPARLGEVARQR